MAPAEGIRGDEALLERVGPEPIARWWRPSSAAVAVGLALHYRIEAVVDVERCRTLGVDVVARRAGGGAVWLDEHVLCGAICVPVSDLPSDVTDSYRWLGDLLASSLGGRRIEVAEARADAAALPDVCFGGLSPHEVVDALGRKFVGLAQVRRRHAALFMIGILCDSRDQSPLSEFMRAPVRDALRERSVGLSSTPQQVFAAVSAACSTGAMPFAL